MKSPKLIIYFLLMLAITSNTACKKKGTSPLGSSHLLFVNRTNSNGDATYYRITYGAGNNVDSIISTGGGTDTGYKNYLTFTYLNSSYIITDKSNDQTTVHLSSSVTIDSIFYGSSTAYTYIQYNGGQVGAVNDEMPIPAYPYYTLNIYDYTYANNNITAINTTGASQAYDYNMAQKGQLGDPQRIDEFLKLGRTYTASANLATDLFNNGSWLEKYFYQLDGNGRITLMTRVINNTSGGANDTLRYAYTYNF